MEARLGADFARVRVHTDDAAAAAARAVGARAFTLGDEIFFAGGAFAPRTMAGQQLIAHELTHVVQAYQGRTPAPGGELAVSRPDDVLEREAASVEAAVAAQPARDAEPGLAHDAPVAAAPVVASRSLSPAREAIGLMFRAPDPAAAKQPGKTPTAPAVSTAPAQGPVKPPVAAAKPATAAKPTTARPATTAAPAKTPPANANTAVTRSTATAGTAPATPPRVRAAGTAPAGRPSAGVGNAPPELAAHQATVAAKKTAMRAAAAAHKATLQSNATAEKAAIAQPIAAAAARVDTTFQTTRDQIQQSTTAARTAIQTDRQAKLGAVGKAAEAQLVRLGAVARAKRQAMIDAGERRAKAAIAEGETQATRATTECQAKASAAWVLCSRKVAQYQPGKRGDEIAKAIQEMTSKTADQMTQAGREMAATARSDAAALAAKFRSEATDAAAQLPDVERDGATQIGDARDKAIGQVNEIADGAITQLDQAHAKAIADLDGQHQHLTQPIRDSQTQAQAAIDHSTTASAGQIDTQADEAVAKVDEFEARVGPRLAILRGKVLGQQLAEAGQQLDANVGKLDHALGGFVTTCQTTNRAGGVKFIGEAQRMADTAARPLQDTGTKYEAQAAKISGDATVKIDDIAAKAAAGMTKSVDKVGDALQNKVDDADHKWGDELDAGKLALAKKVTDGLAVQAQSLTDLGTHIDDKAHEIQDESWLSRAVKVLGGVLLGILEGAWDLLKGLLVVLLIVLAVVLVIVLIAVILLVLAPELGIAFIAGVIVVAAAIAEFVVAYGAVLLVIAAVLVIGLAIYGVYKAFTTKGISDFDLGRAIGKAIFDVATVFFGEELFGWAGKLFGKVGRWLGLVGGDEAKLTRLLGLVGGDEAKLERLLAAFGGDEAKLERVLGVVGNDAAKLDRLLALVGNDGARLERLLGMLGPDAAKLETLMTRVASAEQLEFLLGEIPNVAELERLLGDAGRGFGASEAGYMLERVLKKMPAGNKSVAAIEQALADEQKFLNKVLRGEQSHPQPPGTTPVGAAREIRGAHSPEILTDPDFRIISQTTNPDGTLNVKFQKVLQPAQPGPPPVAEVLSRPKTSTLAPPGWTDADIVRAGDQVANTAPVSTTRASDGATLQLGTVNGVQFAVIKDASGKVTSSFPTGGTGFSF
jgi:hypothetical protein